MKNTKDAGLPEFRTLDEEREYWEARGPLAEGRKGRANRPKPGQKRSSILAVRLTGEELTRLRDIAANQGLGPSTFARLLLTLAIQGSSGHPTIITMDKLMEALERNLPQSAKAKAEALTKAIAIGDSENPILLIDPSQMNKAKEVTLLLLKALLSAVGIKVVMHEEEEYKELQARVKAKL